MPKSTPPESPKDTDSTANAAKPTPATPEPVAAKLPPFVVERSGRYILGNAPVSGHVNLDFSTPEGRLFACNLAHDLLLAVSDAEANEAAETDNKIDRLASILLTTTDIPVAEAREQAQALLDAGVVLRK